MSLSLLLALFPGVGFILSFSIALECVRCFELTRPLHGAPLSGCDVVEDVAALARMSMNGTCRMVRRFVKSRC